MKKILSIIVILLMFIITGCSLEPENKSTDILQKIQERGKIIAGVSYDSKPFGYINERGELEGLDIDIAKEIAKNILGKETAIEFVRVNGFDSISTISSGKIDFLIAATTITPQRQMLVDFSEPYYTAGQAILVKKGSKIQKIKDLNNKKVIVRLNSTAEKTPKKYAPTAKLIGFKTRTEAFNAFKNGAGDAIISDDALLKGFLIDNPDYIILPSKLSIEPYGIAIQNTPEASSLKRMINQTITQLKSNGNLEKLKQKWKV